MREADRAALLERNDLCVHGRRERLQHVAVDRKADESHGRLRERGCDGKCTSRFVRQRLQAPPDEVLEGWGQLVATCGRALELDRVERVTTGELVDAPEQRPREWAAAALLQQPMQGAEAECAERNAVHE